MIRIKWKVREERLEKRVEMDEKLLWLITDFYGLQPGLQREVYQAFYGTYYGTIYLITRDHQSTEDLLQEVFIKVIDKGPTVDFGDDVNKIRGWLKVVIRNATYNYLRKNKKNRNHTDLESVWNIDGRYKDSVENEVESKIFQESLEYYLGCLKQEYRILIELRSRGLSYREISEQLDIPENNVKQKLHRARNEVKKKMRSDWM